MNGKTEILSWNGQSWFSGRAVGPSVIGFYSQLRGDLPLCFQLVFFFLSQLIDGSTGAQSQTRMQSKKASCLSRLDAKGGSVLFFKDYEHGMGSWYGDLQAESGTDVCSMQ